MSDWHPDNGTNQFTDTDTEHWDKESSKVLSFERDKGCLCIPIRCNSVRTFVLDNRNTETTLIPLKRQYFTALFVHYCIQSAKCTISTKFVFRTRCTFTGTCTFSSKCINKSVL